jgi:HEPN domain-containing protein
MPPKEELVHGWLVRARNDLITGQRALTGDPPIPETAAFHAQQAVEKALKAVLVLNEVDPPRTHAIEMLMARCGSIDPRLDRLAASCAWLTDFAVGGRYPDSDCQPTPDQAREALSLADQVFTIILEVLPPEVRP